jgi:AcrR family transcriptional regulator
MPRPLSKKILATTHGESEAIREHILEVALRVIQREGLAEASTRTIAKEVGIATGTLYNYFDDRLQLLAQTILRRISLLSQPVADRALHVGKRSVASNLHDFVRHSALVMDELVPLIASVFSETELLQALRKEMTSTDAAFNPEQALEEYLIAERELGRIASHIDCGAVASTVVSICHDHAFHRYLLGDMSKNESNLEEIDFIADAIVSSDSLERNDY